jgi:hypothetical protein
MNLTLARTLLKLWTLRLWVGLGVVVAGVAAVAMFAMSHSTVYSIASTQMLVDSPNSALANSNTLLAGYVARAGVFARLMTSDEALRYIGTAAGINGNLIEATGPIEINGSPTATHVPSAMENGQALPASKTYKLTFVQNPSLPTVEVFASAPTTAQAVALANGAVTGFASFVNQLNAGNVSAGNRIEIRQLGQATGGVVDPAASKSIALLAFVAVFAIWCWFVLFVSRLRANLRAAKRGRAGDSSAMLEPPFSALDSRPFAGDPPVSSHSVDGDHPVSSPVADAPNGDPNERLFNRSPSNGGTSDISSTGRTFVRR